jgi:hypothetical protein
VGWSDEFPGHADDGQVVRLEIFASRDKAFESVRSAGSRERDSVG